MVLAILVVSGLAIYTGMEVEDRYDAIGRDKVEQVQEVNEDV